MKRSKRTKKHHHYVSPEHWDRPIAGAYSTVVPNLRTVGAQRHYQYFRMSANYFDELFGIIGADFIKKNNHRWPIQPRMRLAIALMYVPIFRYTVYSPNYGRYLASGDTFRTIAAHYKIGVSTVREIVHDVCTAINSRMTIMVLNRPNKDDWKGIANRFDSKCDFPMCCGSIDGKHVKITVQISYFQLYVPVKTMRFVGNYWWRPRRQIRSNRDVHFVDWLLYRRHAVGRTAEFSEKRKSTTVICINRTSVEHSRGYKGEEMERVMRDVSGFAPVTGKRSGRQSGSSIPSCAYNTFFVHIYITDCNYSRCPYVLPSCSPCIILSSLE
jgi:hypothetical protein